MFSGLCSWRKVGFSGISLLNLIQSPFLQFSARKHCKTNINDPISGKSSFLIINMLAWSRLTKNLDSSNLALFQQWSFCCWRKPFSCLSDVYFHVHYCLQLETEVTPIKDLSFGHWCKISFPLTMYSQQRASCVYWRLIFWNHVGYVRLDTRDLTRLIGYSLSGLMVKIIALVHKISFFLEFTYIPQEIFGWESGARLTASLV